MQSKAVMWKRYLFLLAVAALAACRNPPPSTLSTKQAPPVVGPVVVNASEARTWGALVAFLKREQMPTTTLARESGVAQTTQLSLSERSQEQRLAVADCGVGKTADYLTMSFLVRGDSTRSTVEVTPRFVSTAGLGSIECKSTGQEEHLAAQQIKANAEGTAASK